MWVAAAITGIALLLPRLSNGCESDAENFICGRGTGRHRNARGISADRVPASQMNHRGPSHPRPVMPLLPALGLLPEGLGSLRKLSHVVPTRDVLVCPRRFCRLDRTQLGRRRVAQASRLSYGGAMFQRSPHDFPGRWGVLYGSLFSSPIP